MNNSGNVNLTETFKSKAKYFFSTKTPIHVKFKLSYFKNGIINEVNEDFFILEDFVEGRLVIFYSEIERVDEYRKIGVKPDDK